jgi:hypothetical protein
MKRIRKFARNWIRNHIANDPSRLTEDEIDQLLEELALAERNRHKCVFDSEVGLEIHAETGLIGIYCVCGEVQVHEMQSRED